MKNRARRVAFAGMFIALNIVLTRFFSYTVVIGGVQNIRLGFGEIPVILSGIMLGPVYGAITGALADLIGYPFNPMGPYFPGFTLSSALTGLLPGLMSLLFRKKWTWQSLAITIGITTVITSLTLNTLWLSMMMGKAFIVLLPARIIGNFILVPIYVIVVRLFLTHFNQSEEI
ncbi:MAG: folate family ECF transporter S component [Caldicoprobacterales bacterium]|jgi:ECF transporter S component (folate family)|nr:folate family ECF transporter S component [Clostridiales bacterium]